MSYVEAPDFGGTWRWDKELAENSVITFANGATSSFGSLIGRTNGDALDWWLEEGQALAIGAGELTKKTLVGDWKRVGE